MTIPKGMWLLAVAGALAGAGGQRVTTQTRRRNVIVFVADGLRHGSVNARDTPAFWKIRTEGVHFDNSHSLFPTLTMTNASAIATGHEPGDTGDFSNTMWMGYQAFDTGTFGLPAGTPVPFIENDQILADAGAHFGGNHLGEETLLDAAARHGYNTAAIGKMGPAAIQAPAVVTAVSGGFPPPASTIVVDDSTGTATGPPLVPELLGLLAKEGIAPDAPTRTNGYAATSQYNNGYAGTRTRPGTLAANVVQQQWLVDVATRGILPLFERTPDKPFALVFWSRDPDGTEHDQGDSLQSLVPGINGVTSRAAVQNADRTLARLMAWLDGHPAVKANTDVIVTSDHGFATVSRREIDRAGHTTASQAATHDYVDASGAIDTAKGTLPPGFLAIDLSIDLHLALFDPDRRESAGQGHRVQLSSDPREHPNLGNGLLGASVPKANGSDATAIVAANGGSDLIYVPDGRAETVARIAQILLGYDYVGAVFVDDKYGDIPGTLPLSAVGLVGSAKLPRPAIVVAFRVFYLEAQDLQTAVQVSDSTRQEGQGAHGGSGRDSTYNNMAAVGPDFKRGFVDSAPVSNADITPTLARIMNLELTARGSLRGRVMLEALRDGATAPAVRTKRLRSTAANGRSTLLQYQEIGQTRYTLAACIVAEEPDSQASCW